MPVTKVLDVAYVRFRAPDLDKMETYLTTFGMARSERTNDALYMRGTGSDFALHITERGDPAFLGVAFQAGSKDDLARLAKTHDTVVEERSEPGGGFVVRLQDPSGHSIEVVADIAELDGLPTRLDHPRNCANQKLRTNQTVRIGDGPSQVRRLGHVVLNCIDYKTSLAWYQENFGLLISDEIYIGEKDALLGSFLRCDRGDQPVDHHTLFVVGAGKAEFNHAAFEVENFDDLMLGHTALKDAGAQSVWGIGRHIYGSQIFDYWKDPWGFKLEHWTDGDLFTADEPPRLQPIDGLLASQWGGEAPPEMA